MQKIIILLLFVPFVLISQIKTRRVLFIGNSYTFFNNLPQLVYEVAKANKDSLVFDNHCPGGYTFFNHSVDNTALSKIKLGNWDYVVLQAQSQEPSFSPNQVNSQTLPFAIALDTTIQNNNNCASTVFFQTWGRKFGDASNCASYPPVCTYTGMQNRLKQSYKLFADTTHGLMAPVGEAFRKSISTNPNLELYQSDQSHPSLEGSYLAACVFYEILFQKTVLTNTFNPGIGTSTLSFLQSTAHSVIEDSLLVWNIGKYSPKANFTHSLITNGNYQFDAQFPWLNHTWYFGDGTSATGSNLQHQYLSSGIKLVSHIVDNGCKKDSLISQIAVNYVNTGIRELTDGSEMITLYPNPITDKITIKGNRSSVSSLFSGEILDLVGKKILSFEKAAEINISEFKAGYYTLITNYEGYSVTVKFIKYD
jgi:PKD repeat protein